MKTKNNCVDYFRSFKNYTDIPSRDCFAARMAKKYPDDEMAHYQDPEYVDAAYYFFGFAGKKVVGLFKALLNGRHEDVLTKTERKQFCDPKIIVDLGAGVGLLTAEMKKLFPNAIVYYVNLRGPQWDEAKKIFQKENVSIKMRESICGIPQADIVLAIYYFEHFQKMGREVCQTLKSLRPDILIDMTDPQHAFIGHFPTYRINGKTIPHTKCHREYTKLLARKNYFRHPLTKKCWNSIPKVYTKPMKEGAE